MPRQHGGQLAAEDRDIARIDPAARAALTLLADARGRHALPAQFCAQSLLIGREALALTRAPRLSLPSQAKGVSAFDRPECACLLPEP